MSCVSAGSTIDAREAAVGTIRAEHGALRTMLEALQRLVDDVSQRRRDPDFPLLAAMLYYIDIFPERCHHPREDEHLFKRLRQRTTRADSLLDELQGQHIRSAQLIAYAQQAFVHYEAGAADGLKLFVDAINAYAGLMSDHIRQEEADVLPLAREYLTGEDWAAVGAAFGAEGDLPFGKRQDFSALRQRIIDRLPPGLASR